MNDALIAVRTLHFAATFAASGTVLFTALIAAPAAAPSAGEFARLHRWTRMLCAGALLLAVLTWTAWLFLVSADIVGKPVVAAVLSGGAWDVLSETRFGSYWSARLVLALTLGVLVARPRLPAIRLAVAAAFVALLAFTGHASAAGNIQRIADMAHLLAAGAWLGSLPAFAMALAAGRRADTKPWQAFVVVATHRFSILGVVCVGMLFASGIVNSWYLLGGLRDLWTTGYGRLIALKIGLFALMIGVAAVNRFILTPRLPDAGATRGLLLGSLAENVLGLGVLAVVGTLGITEPTAHVHPPAISIPSAAAFVHIHDLEAMADVTIDPGHVGRARATIRVSREDFSPYPARVVLLSLLPPKPGNGSFEQRAVEQANGTWSVNDIEFDRDGVWTLRVTVTGRSGNAIVLDAPIVIER